MSPKAVALAVGIASVAALYAVAAPAGEVLAAPTTRSSATTFHPSPYTVGCVMAAFGASGAPLWNIYPTSGKTFSWVILRPKATALTIHIEVAATPRKAQTLLAEAKLNEKLHPRSNAIFKAEAAGNVYISYRDRRRERTVVTRSLHRLTVTGCAHS